MLIDGSGFIFRAFHALPPMTSPDGTPVNAVFGFTNMLWRLRREHTGSHLAVIFDAGRLTFRNRLYEPYKAHRPPAPEELVPQFPLVREATEAFAIPAIERADWEADDLIAAYTACAREAGGSVTIVSSDKDLMQLVGPGVGMLDPIKQAMIGPAEVVAKFGVPPEQMIDLQALIGDPTDNVPGVPGIGPKRAAELLAAFGNLDQVLAAAPGMKPGKRRDALIEHADLARLSRELVRLRADAPLPLPLAALAVRPAEPARLRAFLAAQGFRSLLARLEPEPAAEAAPAPPPPPEAGGFGPYVTIADAATLAAWVAQARAAGVVAIDTETDGLDALRAAITGISLAVAPGQAAYVPLAHRELTAQLSLEAVRGALAPLVADDTVMKVYQNAKFDREVMARAGFPAPVPFDDTMLISCAMASGAHGHGMDELSLLHLGHRPIPFDEVTGTGRARIPFAEVPIDRATAYAAEDADVTLRLWQTLRPRLREAKALALYERLERPLVAVLEAMEQAGILVDAAELRRISVEFAARMATMETEIHRLAGHDFNVASAKQLGEVLFDEMGIPGGKRMKTGAWGTDAAVLQALADQGIALAGQVLDWRQLAKLKSTYADALVEQINPETGRVHTSYAQAIVATGRLSSTDPNLQNIPVRTEEGGRIRRAFIAAPGAVLVSADYSQIELRLLAHVADIPALRASFANGEDIHARTAAEVFGVPLAGMDPMLRRRAKAINFGIIYGISGFGLARQLGIEPGEARRLIDAYFIRYPEIRAYMEHTREAARRQGYVESPFGRRCFVPGIADRNAARRAYAERQAINAPLQGGAADIIKRAMLRLPDALAAEGLRARMLLQVHDELLFEAPEAEADRVAAIARQVMEGAASLSVALVVETGKGRNWAEAH